MLHVCVSYPAFYTKHTLLHFFSVFYCAGQCHAVSISYVTAGRKAAGNPCNTDRKRFNQAGQVVCCRFAFCIGVCRNNDFFYCIIGEPV